MDTLASGLGRCPAGATGWRGIYVDSPRASQLFGASAHGHIGNGVGALPGRTLCSTDRTRLGGNNWLHPCAIVSIPAHEFHGQFSTRCSFHVGKGSTNRCVATPSGNMLQPVVGG